MENASFIGFESLFAARLRDLVEQEKISKQQLADEIGVSRQAISQYCDGSTIPNAEKLLRIAEYFGVSLDYLVGRTENVVIEEEGKFVCNYTGFSEKVIDTYREVFEEFIYNGIITEDEFDFVHNHYNEILLLIIKNREFLWRIFQSKLSLSTLIRKEKRIESILNLENLDSDAFFDIDHLDLIGSHSRSLEKFQLQMFIALEECRGIIADFTQAERTELLELQEKNAIRRSELTEEEHNLIFECWGNANNANNN